MIVRRLLNYPWLAPLIFAVSICLSHIHQGTLAVDAIRYAHIARHIVLTNDWFSLIDGLTDERYVNKPPFLFWCVAVLFKIFGFSTFAAKLPSALFTIAGLMLLWSFVRRYYSVTTAHWALLIAVLNTNFMRSMVDLSFEGLIACGGMVCLFALARLATARGGVLTGLLWGLGMLLLLQTKPPYAVLVIGASALYALAERSVRVAILSPRFLLGALPPVLLGATWFFFLREEYLRAALANQVALPLEESASPPLNLVRWILSIFKNYTVAAFFAAAAIISLIKDRRWEWREKLLLCWLAMLPPIMLLIDVRPRYIVLPMLAVFILASSPCARTFSRLRERTIAVVLLAAALLMPLLFVGVGIEVHRSDPLIALAREVPSTLETDTVFCLEVEEGSEKSQRKARMATLLFELEFERRPRVVAFHQLVSNPITRPQTLAVTSQCRRALEESGIRTSSVLEIRGAELIQIE